MADQTSPIQQIQSATNVATRVNENFDAASPSMLYGRNAATTAGLTWGYIGGRFGGALIASGTVTLAASTVNYIVAALADGAVSVSASTTNWSNDAAYLPLYMVTTGTDAVTDSEDHRQAYGLGGGGGGGGSTPLIIPIACSDETTALTTGAAKVTFRMPCAMTLAAVRASLTTAQASGSIFTVDVNEGGSSILSTKLTIDNTEKTSTTAATAPVMSDANLADDAEITIDIDQVGDGTAKGLKVYLIGWPA